MENTDPTPRAVNPPNPRRERSGSGPDTDNLHMHDLPRPRAAARTGTDRTGGSSATATADPLQPVEFTETGNGAPAKATSRSTTPQGELLYDDKAREAELMELNQSPAPRPVARPRAVTPTPTVPDAANPKTTAHPADEGQPTPSPVPEAPSLPEITLPHRRRPGEAVLPPAGVVRMSGRTLRLPMGVHVAPGDRIMMGGRPFEVKKERAFTTQFWLKGVALVGLILLAAVGVSHVAAGPQGGSITGVVVDRLSGRVIPNATVTVEGGATTKANVAGLYAIDNLAPGLFRLTAVANGYEPQTGTTVRPARENAQLAFALMPLYAEADVPAAPYIPPPATPERANTDAAPTVAYGYVTLTTDLEDYVFYVDDVLYGKNATKIKRVSVGDHKIVLQVEGYENYSTTVHVKERATATVTVAKADLAPKVNPVRRAQGHFAEAKKFLDQGQWQQAIEAFDRSLEYEPGNPEALQYRGWAYFKSNNPAKARPDFLRAVELYRSGDRLLDAVACAGYLIDLDPRDPEGYLRRAGCYMALTEYGKAISDYEQAVKLDKKSPAAQMALGEACFVSGDYKRAAKEFEKARKLAADPVDAYVRMLMALTRAGSDDQVRRRYKELAAVATPERLQQLRADPEWLRVLQIVDPTLRSQG